MSSVFFLVSDLLLAAVRSWVGLALIHWLLMPKSSVGDAPNPDFSPKESSFTESPSAPLARSLGGSSLRRLLTNFSQKLPAGISPRRLLAGIIGSALLAVITMVCGLEDVYRFLPEALYLALCSRPPRDREFRISLFVSIFFEIAAGLWLFLVTAWLGVLFHDREFPDRTSPCSLAAVWLIFLLLAVLGVLLLLKPDWLKKKSRSLLTPLMVIGLGAVVTLGSQTKLAVPDDLLSSWTILAVLLMLAVILFRTNRQYETEKELSELKSAQAELLQANYTALNQAYSANARLFHDLHTHIGVLKNLLDHQNYQEASDYLAELGEPIQRLTHTRYTGDETIDYLISSKAAQAEQEETAFTVNVEYPPNAGIRSADLSAILGNLLDNALEASALVEDPHNRQIHLTIRRINQMLVIKVENYFENALNLGQGQPNTTKADSSLHGFGLKSAKTAAEKYDGTLRTTFDGNHFKAVATLSFSPIKPPLQP